MIIYIQNTKKNGQYGQTVTRLYYV